MNMAVEPLKPRHFEHIVLARLFGDLADAGLAFAVLRNHEQLPFRLGARDLDLLVRPGDLTSALAIVVRMAGDFGLSFANYYADERMLQVTLMGRTNGALFDLKIDFFTSSQVYGIELLSAEEMLAELRWHNHIPVVSETVALLDKWLFHLAVGKRLDAKYDPVFAQIAATRKVRLLNKLAPLLGEEEARRQIALMSAGRASSIQLTRRRRMRILLRMWLRQEGRGFSRSGRFAAERLRNFLRPHGLFVSISGPDGSGKTTVIDLALEQLRQIYGVNGVAYHHFRPTMLPRIAEMARAAGSGSAVDADYSRPHRARPSGPFGSIVRLAYYALDYLGGYWRVVRPALKDRKIVVFDRYYHDMICDPGRSRMRLPDSWLRAVGRLLPLPRLSVFVRVSPEIAYRRKQELTLEQISALNSRYDNLVARGWMIEIGNEGPPEQAAKAIVDLVVGRYGKMARRALKGVAE